MDESVNKEQSQKENSPCSLESPRDTLARIRGVLTDPTYP